MNRVQFGRPPTLKHLSVLALMTQGKTRKEMASILDLKLTSVYGRFNAMKNYIMVHGAREGTDEWDLSMIRWVNVNQKKLLIYARLVQSHGHTHNYPYLTLKTLWLEAGLDLLPE
jgi:hypothetical protein